MSFRAQDERTVHFVVELIVELVRPFVEADCPNVARLQFLKRAAQIYHLGDGQILRGSSGSFYHRGVHAYRTALGVQSSIPQAWLGLGISLEALQQRAAAAEAFKNALAAGPVSAEVRTFAEQRIKALR